MAPVVEALRADDRFRPIVVATGQHREMLHQVLDLFEIEPDHDLAVMQPGQTLASLTGRLVTAIDEVLEQDPPDLSLVQGDTTTAFVGGLASFYRGIRVGHVEAGLRTDDLMTPFPEEGNRRLVGRITSVHFAPTTGARQNLLREGVDPETVVVTGNTVIDALFRQLELQRSRNRTSALLEALTADLGFSPEAKPYVLVTGHRRENFGAGFEEICGALSELSRRFEDHTFVYPVHLNPRVQGPVHETLGDRPNVKLIAPRSYEEFLVLMQHCRVVLTDSGGVQEEAPSLGKPVLVMRENTERPEGVEAGTVRLVGADRDRIVAAVEELLVDEDAYAEMARAENPYGDGKASQRIVEELARILG